MLRARRRAAANRFASHSPAFLSQDGGDPNGRLSRFTNTTLAWHDGIGEGSRGAFGVLLADGPSAEGRRVFFATGVSDTLPRANGLA